MEKEKINIYDISQATGVSIATVSRVLNGSERVSDETRKRVMEVISEKGYTPSVFARNLGSNRLKTVGIMCADSSDPYLALAVYYIEEELQKNGYDSILCCTGYELENKKKRLNLLLSKRIEGLFMIGSNYIEADDRQNAYIRNAARFAPVMILNGSLEGDNIYSIPSDDFGAVFNLTEKFILSDRKKLLYIYNSNSFSGKKKMDGFKAALEAHGLNFSTENLLFFEIKNNSSVIVLRDLLESLHRQGMAFDGVIGAEDRLAVGAVKYASANGISIPNELFVAGFNNSYLSNCCEPELTSIDNLLELRCREGVQKMLKLLSGESVERISKYSFEIVQRGTTAFVE